MENSQPPTERVYKNQLIYEKCYDTLIKTTSDVHFIFQTETDEVQIPANKSVLAAGSPVFQAMFYGDLKEKGDIKIVDVSSAAFREFLQFFYEYQVKLTMDNICDVLKLIDKYGVVNGFPICIEFLRDNLTLDDILWGLHLSIKFRLEELETFSKKKIEANYLTVFDKIDVNNEGKISASNGSNRISEIDWKAVLPHVFMASKNVIRNISEQLQNKKAIYFVTVASTEYSYQRLSNNETIVFSLDRAMMLTDIVCSNVHSAYRIMTERSFNITIERKAQISTWYPDVLYDADVDLKMGRNPVKLATPILIEPQYVYAVNFNSDMESETFYTTKRSVVTNSDVELAPGVNIRFLGESEKSLISFLYFTHLNN